MSAPPTLLSLGFRPFFLLAASHATVAMALWVTWLGAHMANAAVVTLSISGSPYVWHGHEMVFGFLSAAVAGFLLTATPNWTGTPAITGRRLAILVAAWLAGRAGLWLSAWLPDEMVIGLDMLFLPLLAALMAGPLLRARKGPNMVFILLLGLMACGALLSNLGNINVLEDGGRLGRVLGIDTVVMMMVVVGGRITPAFTRNWLVARTAPAQDIGAPKILERAAIITAAAALIVDLAPLPPGLKASMLIAAGLLLLARLWFWRPWRVVKEPLLWVLGLGTLWVGLGFVARGLAEVIPDLSTTAALHAHAVGAAGTMIAGVMGRASLGHTGRPLKATRAMTATYILITLAALTRILAPTLLPGLYLEGMVVAGLLWVAAFGLFVGGFFSILTTPRS